MLIVETLYRYFSHNQFRLRNCSYCNFLKLFLCVPIWIFFVKLHKNCFKFWNNLKCTQQGQSLQTDCSQKEARHNSSYSKWMCTSMVSTKASDTASEWRHDHSMFITHWNTETTSHKSLDTLPLGKAIRLNGQCLHPCWPTRNMSLLLNATGELIVAMQHGGPTASTAKNYMHAWASIWPKR